MDKISAEKRSANMRAIRSTDTAPEMVVRRLVHRMGYRYRLHRKDLPGKPDLVFCSRKKIIFVHGCFWHQHNKKDCKLARKPKTNTNYWLPKFKRTVRRDREHQIALEKAGWAVLIVWECEVGKTEYLKRKLQNFLNSKP